MDHHDSTLFRQNRRILEPFTIKKRKEKESFLFKGRVRLYFRVTPRRRLPSGESLTGLTGSPEVKSERLKVPSCLFVP